MQRTTMWRAVGCSLAMLLLMVLLSAGGSETQAGGAVRFYQVATPALTIMTDPVYGNPQPAFSFVVEEPGRVVAIWIAPTKTIRASMEDRVVGSVWVNASNGPTIDDLFAITADVPAMGLHKLADIGMPQTYDMPVARGDVVTVLLGDESSGSPPLPAATWVLEVQP